MDVKLPNGVIIKNVPEGTSKEAVKQKAISAGVAKLEDFGDSASTTADIPLYDDQGSPIEADAPQQQSSGEVNPLNMLGGLEAAASVGSGLLSSLQGVGIGLVDSVTSGAFIEGRGPEVVNQSIADYVKAGTYQPRTRAGRDIVGVIGEASELLPPVVAGFSPAQMAIAGQSARAASQVAPTVARGAAQSVAQALPQMPQQGSARSIGAAEIQPEQVRRQAAQDLPVPLNITKGMATQDFEQQRFERETAKDAELGAPIRERMSELNQGIGQNIDEFISATGTSLPETAWRLETGNKVIQALEKGYRAEKSKVDNAYKAARAKGETQEIINVSPLADYLNESRVDVTVAPVVGAIAKEAERLGVGRGKIEDGSFEILPMTIEQSETLRQRVNDLVDNTKGQDLRRASQIKQLIDSAQDSAGGKVFQSARKQRQQLANKYENLAIIDQLLDTKGQYNDQKIAAENVINKAVINGSVEDLKNLRRVLSTAGDDGLDALKEVRAAAVRHVRDEATRNVGRDPNGNPLISAKGMDNAIKALDKNGKLDLLFGKKEADKLRLLNDVAKDILVAQPNAVNNSNTASVLLGTLDVMSSMATGVPVPVLLGLKTTRDKLKNAKTSKKIQEALK